MGKWVLRSVALLTFAGAATLLSAQPPRTPLPGTVNYVEGQAAINGAPLAVKQDGNTQVQPNQNLTTANGKVEMLLSPGVFLREASNSDVRLISNGLANPSVEVVRGEALVEVDAKPHGARIQVQEHGATALIVKQGLYDFDSAGNRIAVLDGKIRVTENDRTKEFGKGHELALDNPKLKTESFDAKTAENNDELYRWSSVRAGYLAEANQATAQNIYMGYNPWWGAGWYWDPYFAMWSWMPGDGWFYGPFGYPFFAPGYAIYAGGFYGGRYGFRGGYPARFGVRGFAGNAYRAGVRGGAFRGGGFARGGFAGGGFHGGLGGGFHGGGRR